MANARKLNVCVVDDHPLFAQGLTNFLETVPVVNRVTSVNSHAQLQELINSWVPNFMFLDLNIPPTDGFTICEAVKAKHPDTFICIISQYDSPTYVHRAKKCGADAYFIKNTDPEVLANFLTAYVNNQVKGFYDHVPPGNPMPSFVADDFETRQTLTLREQEVMHLLAEGANFKEIKKALGISYSTYKIHRLNVMRKLNLKNDVEFGMFVFEKLGPPAKQ